MRSAALLVTLCPLLVGAVAWGVSKSKEPAGEEMTSRTCGLIPAYGTIFHAASGIEVAVENRAELLQQVRLCTEALLSEEALSRYRELVRSIEGPQVTPDERAERDFVLVELGAALAQSDSALSNRLAARRLIQGWRDTTEIVEKQRARGALEAAGWASSSPKSARHDAAAYYAECEAAGVPVPGSFAADGNWSGPTILDDETHRYLFRSNWRKAKAWTYRAADGGYCVALMRENPDDPAAAVYVGAICTNPQEVDACFFDNIVYEGASGTRRIGWEDFRVTPFRDLVHPLDGEDKCNFCHLGKNPFIVNPATKLGQTIRSMYPAVQGTGRFRFTGLETTGEKWFNYPAMSVVPGSPGCMRCHEIPAVTKHHSFCSGIIERAANTMMPPNYWPDDAAIHAHFWPDDEGCFDPSLASLADYFPSMIRIKHFCSGSLEKACSSN